MLYIEYVSDKKGIPFDLTLLKTDSVTILHIQCLGEFSIDSLLAEYILKLVFPQIYTYFLCQIL